MITITHTRADGTLVDGTSKGDGAAAALKASSRAWHWSRPLDRWYLQQSREQPAKTWIIGAAAEKLRAAGFEVDVSIDDLTPGRSIAEIEADRADRATDRTERFAGYADGAAARSDAAYQRAHEIGDAIPFGQPVHVGHHSERHHRADLNRIDAAMSRSVTEQGKAEHWTDRAAATERHQKHRLSMGATRRRIDKLEADLRAAERRRDQATDGSKAHALNETEISHLHEQITFWQRHITELQEAGHKVWGPDDFTPGDYVVAPARQGTGGATRQQEIGHGPGDHLRPDPHAHRKRAGGARRAP